MDYLVHQPTAKQESFLMKNEGLEIILSMAQWDI